LIFNAKVFMPSLHAQFLTISTIAASLLCLVSSPVLAQGNTVYKCTKNGKVEYSNAPCDQAAQPAKLKGTVNSLPKEAFVGQNKTTKDAGKVTSGGKTILGITPPNPIEECRKKGGKLNLEFKACELP
jgi:Domain of unknown function (DUF4124)